MKILVLFFLFVSTASAGSSLTDVFTKTFYTSYESGQCGDNILGLLLKADAEGVDIRSTRIVEMINVGHSVFGLVNAENARNQGRPNRSFPSYGLERLPGEKNWYHHWVLEQDGLIYDFDFGNTPAVTPALTYFEKMFLTDLKESEGGKFSPGREEKLKNYQITYYSGQEAVDKANDRIASFKENKLLLRDCLTFFKH
jgi:hypothetical protein